MSALACPQPDCDFDVEDEPGAQFVLLHHLQGWPHYRSRAEAEWLLGQVEEGSE